MRNISQLIVSLTLLASQVQNPFQDFTASAQASSLAAESIEVSFNPVTATPVVISGPKRPDYESEVLAPLRAHQAATAETQRVAAAKLAQAKLRKTTVAKTTATMVAAAATPAHMLALRLCEAGNIYTRNSGNGYYGAYQYNLSTWGNYGGYTRPDIAPSHVQDAKFMETFARRGWSPWPSCSRKLGFR